VVDQVARQVQKREEAAKKPSASPRPPSPVSRGVRPDRPMSFGIQPGRPPVPGGCGGIRPDRPPPPLIPPSDPMSEAERMRREAERLRKRYGR